MVGTIDACSRDGDRRESRLRSGGEMLSGGKPAFLHRRRLILLLCVMWGGFGEVVRESDQGHRTASRLDTSHRSAPSGMMWFHLLPRRDHVLRGVLPARFLYARACFRCRGCRRRGHGNADQLSTCGRTTRRPGRRTARPPSAARSRRFRRGAFRCSVPFADPPDLGRRDQDRAPRAVRFSLRQLLAFLRHRRARLHLPAARTRECLQGVSST